MYCGLGELGGGGVPGVFPELPQAAFKLDIAKKARCSSGPSPGAPEGPGPKAGWSPSLATLSQTSLQRGSRAY